MAISGLTFTSRSQIHLRNPIFQCVRKAWLSSVAIEAFDEPEHFPNIQSSHNLVHETDLAREHIDNDDDSHNLVHETGSGDREVKWKKLNSNDLGIDNSMITKPIRKVLSNLKQNGHYVYLVGGCVRDLLLNRTPKDFDIITSAELRQVRRVFSWCEIVGKRFPICHVHVDNIVVEVSSFSTSQNRAGDEMNHLSELPTGFEEDDYVRWRNCLHRDFTINGFMFDPFECKVYDYLGGIEDLKKAEVQTVIPADLSFQEDCARILRAVRIAARLGFRISRETAHFVKHYSGSVLRLDKGRLLMEVNYMLAFGSAEASLRLLWKFGLLELLLPIQAAYFARTGFRRRDKRTNMLLSLFSNMDKLLAPDKPCNGSLWVAILAFHKALLDQPRHPSVVAAFSLTINSGGDISEAIKIATSINRPHEAIFSELVSEPCEMGPLEFEDEVMDLAGSVVRSLKYLSDEQIISSAMARYSTAPFSDLVVISPWLYSKVYDVFGCMRLGRSFGCKQGCEINYAELASGSIDEVRHVFARIVFDTVYPLN